jgi:hypothetical protein
MWVQGRVMNVGQLTEELYHKIRLKSPKEWFSEKIKYNIDNHYDERDYARQTGRTTYNCLTAISHLMKGDDVLIPVYNTNMSRTMSSFIERTMLEIDVPIAKSQRTSGYMQLHNGAQLMFVPMGTKYARGVSQLTGLGMGSKERTVDVVLPDNVIFDVINKQVTYDESEPSDDELFLNECESMLKHDKRINPNKKTFMTSCGVGFENGDLIDHGFTGALIVDLYHDRHNMSVLIDGQIRRWHRNDLNLMCKVE